MTPPVSSDAPHLPDGAPAAPAAGDVGVQLQDGVHGAGQVHSRGQWESGSLRERNDADVGGQMEGFRVINSLVCTLFNI